MKKENIKIEPLKQVVTRIQLMQVYEELKNMGHLRGVAFVNAIERNMIRMDRIFKQTRNWAYKNSPNSDGKLKTYYEEYNKITSLHCEMLPNGKPKLDAFGAVKIKNKEAYDIAMKELSEKFPKEEAMLKDFDKRYERLLSEPFEFEFYKILYSNLPEDISMEEKSVIQFLIEGDPVKEEFKNELPEIPDDYGIPNNTNDLSDSRTDGKPIMEDVPGHVEEHSESMKHIEESRPATQEEVENLAKESQEENLPSSNMTENNVDNSDAIKPETADNKSLE